MAMPNFAVFQSHTTQYEDWFENNQAAYLSELLALRPFTPWSGHGLEIGVGSGRFAAPLGVAVGIDPASAMLTRAAARGIEVFEGVAEDLPFDADCFDYVLLVTTICFVDSPMQMLSEIDRVLKPGGCLVIGFIDRDSEIGRDYQEHQEQSVFYRDARFFSADEVEVLLEQAGFVVNAWAQTLSRPLPEIQEIEPLSPGQGQGAFIVVTAAKAT